MRNLELLILRDLSERLYVLSLNFSVLLIRYWPRKILEYVHNFIIGNLSILFRYVVCIEYFQSLFMCQNNY